MRKLKFKKKIIGGVDELDVLKKIKMINQEYQTLLEEEKMKYEAIIDEKNKEIARLKY